MSDDRESAEPFVPQKHTLSVLKTAAKGCRGCHLYKDATQTVFGRGKAGDIMLVGEQPGNAEDLAGEAFVGPAGVLLARALDDSKMDQRRVYVTNAVKHFKFELRGKRRIHQSPKVLEIQACRPWLEAEVDAVRPKLIVCLGKTAAQSVLGREVKVMSERGKFFDGPHGVLAFVTVHPSMLLRIPDAASKEQGYREFVRDLRKAAAKAAE